MQRARDWRQSKRAAARVARKQCVWCIEATGLYSDTATSVVLVHGRRKGNGCAYTFGCKATATEEKRHQQETNQIAATEARATSGDRGHPEEQVVVGSRRDRLQRCDIQRSV